MEIEARLHLQHTDKSPSEHYIQEVKGRFTSKPNTGDYSLVLEPANNVQFAAITSGPCVVLILLFIFDWPKKAEAMEQEIRKQRGLPDPENFLDMSDGEYSACVRLNFEDGYAFKRCSMQKINDGHYKAVVDTVHRYPSTKSKDITKILPHDVTLTDAGPGKLIGRSQVRWLKNNSETLAGDAQIEVDLKSQFKRLPMTEIFSYEFNHSPFDSYPFTLEAKGIMRAVDTTPVKVEFDEVKKVYGNEISD